MGVAGSGRHTLPGSAHLRHGALLGLRVQRNLIVHLGAQCRFKYLLRGIGLVVLLLVAAQVGLEDACGADWQSLRK